MFLKIIANIYLIRCIDSGLTVHIFIGKPEPTTAGIYGLKYFIPILRLVFFLKNKTSSNILFGSRFEKPQRYSHCCMSHGIKSHKSAQWSVANVQ